MIVVSSWTVDDAGVRPRGARGFRRHRPPRATDRIREAILRALRRSRRPLTRSELFDRVGGGANTFYALIDELLADGSNDVVEVIEADVGGRQRRKVAVR